MIELYTHPMSPCAQKVRILLVEKGLDWQAHLIDLAQKENLKPEYLKLNPLGVVPTLVDAGKVVIESSIICEYLDDAYPQKTFRPDDPYDVSKMRFWMKHVDNKLHPSCGAIQWPMIMRPAMLERSPDERARLLDKIPEKPRRERQRRLIEMGLDAPDVADAVKTYRKTVLDMEKDLEGHEWLLGETLTLADICLIPYFQTLFQFEWTGVYDDCPKVKQWTQKWFDRPSFVKAVRSDFTFETLENCKRIGSAAWPKIKAYL